MKRFIVLLLFLVAVSCREESSYRHAVRDAEELLSEQPDSSLSLLLPYQSFHSRRPRSRAEFARVFSMVLDKNYIDVNDDSLALVAWNYYKKRPLSRERMLSAYSLGRVQLNKQDYIASMLSFRRSLEDSRQLGDRHYEGLSLRNISSVYDQTYDIVHSLEYMREAYTIFHGSGEQLYADYAKLSIALTYLNMRDVHSCDSVLRELKNVSDDNIQFQVNKAYMDVMYSLTPPNPEGVLKYYRLAKEYKYSQFSAKDYTTVGTAFGLLNQPDSMRYYWEKAASEAANEEDRIAAVYDQYVVDSSEGQYERALSSLKTAVAFQDSLVNEKLRQSPVAMAGVMEASNSIIRQGRGDDGRWNLQNVRPEIVLMDGFLGLATTYFGGKLSTSVSHSLGAITSKIPGKAWEGLVNRGLTGAVTGFIIGSGISALDQWKQYQETGYYDWASVWNSGWRSALIGFATGGISGVVEGIIVARNNYENPWSGNDWYPDKHGFEGAPITGLLQPGVYDRYGGDYGSFLAPEGTPFEQRSLPSYKNDNLIYSRYEVVKPIPNVMIGKTAPWFGYPGGGTQYYLPNSIQYYIDNGFIIKL